MPMETAPIIPLRYRHDGIGELYNFERNEAADSVKIPLESSNRQPDAISRNIGVGNRRSGRPVALQE
jgi:hypothetical protein